MIAKSDDDNDECGCFSCFYFGIEYLLEWFLYYRENIIGIYLYLYVACRERDG